MISSSSRNKIYQKYGYRCAYCGRGIKKNEFTVDHIIPKRLGGKDNIENLHPCCPPCNKMKSCLSLNDFREALKQYGHNGEFFFEKIERLRKKKKEWERKYVAIANILKINTGGKSMADNYYCKMTYSKKSMDNILTMLYHLGYGLTTIGNTEEDVRNDNELGDVLKWPSQCLEAIEKGGELFTMEDENGKNSPFLSVTMDRETAAKMMEIYSAYMDGLLENHFIGMREDIPSYKKRLEEFYKKIEAKIGNDSVDEN